MGIASTNAEVDRRRWFRYSPRLSLWESSDTLPGSPRETKPMRNLKAVQ